MAKQALGKGLGALIGGVTKGSSGSGAASGAAFAKPHEGEVVEEVGIGDVVPSPLQPRTVFEGEQLEELVKSIEEHGIIQPLVVRLVEGKRELIAGERRWRAAKGLGLAKVPVITREVSDQDVLEMALIENLQREDLNAIEEARAYARLAKDFGMRQEAIAKRVGKNRATVANAIRLLELDAGVQEMVERGQLTVGHAKVILSVKVAGDQGAVAREIVDGGLSVRAAERLVQARNKPGAKKKVAAVKVDPGFEQALKAVEDDLRNKLSTAVQVAHKGGVESKGKIEIEYYGVEDLNRILEEMGAGAGDFDL